MDVWRKLLLVGLLAVTGALASGCTFFACDGGGPLTRDELGDWAAISEGAKPTAEEMRQLHEGDDWGPFDWGAYFRTGHWRIDLSMPRPGLVDWEPHSSLDFPTMPGYETRFMYPSYRWLFPSARHGVSLIMPKAGRQASDLRKFFGSRHGYGLGFILGEFLLSGSTRNLYDNSTQERVAASKANIFLSWAGYVRVREVVPVDDHGDAGLVVLKDMDTELSAVRYQLKDGTCLLLGILGWGRVNHKRYIQLLWIPISVGQVDL